MCFLIFLFRAEDLGFEEEDFEGEGFEGEDFVGTRLVGGDFEEVLGGEGELEFEEVWEWDFWEGEGLRVGGARVWGLCGAGSFSAAADFLPYLSLFFNLDLRKLLRSLCFLDSPTKTKGFSVLLLRLPPLLVVVPVSVSFSSTANAGIEDLGTGDWV